MSKWLPELTLDRCLKQSPSPPVARWVDLVASLIYAEAAGLALILTCGQLLALQHVWLAIRQWSDADQRGLAGCDGSFSVWRFHTRLNQPARDPCITADQQTNAISMEDLALKRFLAKHFDPIAADHTSQYA